MKVERLALIKQEILKIDADVVCLQEVELGSVVDDFSNIFPNYYIHNNSKKRTNTIGNLTA